jgi:phage-related minor tail protein
MDEDDEGRIEALSGQMERLNGLTTQFGKALSRSLSQGITQGKSFEDILRSIGQRFLDLALRSAFKPLEGMMSGFGQSLLGGIGNLFSGGGVANGPPLSITPFADGGVVSAPHYFPLGRGLGLMGERGAEAIMPLARGPDGRLGVAAQGGRGVSVVMNISTPDAESFRRSETQVSAALARAVNRGARGL